MKVEKTHRSIHSFLGQTLIMSTYIRVQRHTNTHICPFVICGSFIWTWSGVGNAIDYRKRSYAKGQQCYSCCRQQHYTHTTHHSHCSRSNPYDQSVILGAYDDMDFSLPFPPFPKHYCIYQVQLTDVYIYRVDLCHQEGAIQYQKDIPALPSRCTINVCKLIPLLIKIRCTSTIHESDSH